MTFDEFFLKIMTYFHGSRTTGERTQMFQAIMDMWYGYRNYCVTTGELETQSQMPSDLKDLEEFDLKKHGGSETALLGLLPVVKASKTAILTHCKLSVLCCGHLASVLDSSSLKHLDLSHSDLEDSGVELLCHGLSSVHCKLETLSLTHCQLSVLCCGHLASVLSSSSLKHLDLSHNDLEDVGVELLCHGLSSVHCKLETLRMSECQILEEGGASLASALSSAFSNLKELDLSYNHPGPSAELLTALRDDPHCPLDTLRLDPAGGQ